MANGNKVSTSSTDLRLDKSSPTSYNASPISLGNLNVHQNLLMPLKNNDTSVTILSPSQVILFPFYVKSRYYGKEKKTKNYSRRFLVDKSVEKATEDDKKPRICKFIPEKEKGIRFCS